MNENFLDLHSDYCNKKKCNNKELDDSPFYFNEHRDCEINPERVLFFIGNQFYLLTFFKCIFGYKEKYNLRETLVKEIIKKNNIYDFYEVSKSIELDGNNFKDFRIKNQALKKYIEQVNYVYSNSAGKRYAITTTTEYIDAYLNQEIIDKNFKEALAFLEKLGYDWLIDELKVLYYTNKLPVHNQIEIHKTIDSIISQINKETK